MLAPINAALQAAKPFVILIAALLGLMSAWGVAVEMLPFLAQVWRPKIDSQRAAVIGAALAIIGSRA